MAFVWILVVDGFCFGFYNLLAFVPDSMYLFALDSIIRWLLFGSYYMLAFALDSSS